MRDNMISFKGSMPAPLYDHGPIILDGSHCHILRREWLESFKSWQYTIDWPGTLLPVHFMEDEVRMKELSK